MTIRIVHTADNHVDLGFKNYPDSVRDILCSERMDALMNIVNAANKKQAHFLVVAGDLFDGVNPNKRTIKSVVDVLGSAISKLSVSFLMLHEVCDPQHFFTLYNFLFDSK